MPSTKIIVPKIFSQKNNPFSETKDNHFKRVAQIDDNKCFKDLRKTFITNMHVEYGDWNLTTTVSDHSSPEVVKKHYLVQIEMAKRMQDFSVFRPPENRL